LADRASAITPPGVVFSSAGYARLLLTLLKQNKNDLRALPPLKTVEKRKKTSNKLQVQTSNARATAEPKD